VSRVPEGERLIFGIPEAVGSLAFLLAVLCLYAYVRDLKDIVLDVLFLRKVRIE
jgi:hypothetical protein